MGSFLVGVTNPKGYLFCSEPCVWVLPLSCSALVLKGEVGRPTAQFPARYGWLTLAENGGTSNISFGAR